MRPPHADGDREEYAQDIPPRRTRPIRAFTKAWQTDGKRIQTRGTMSPRRRAEPCRIARHAERRNGR
jgi:hypothetical protein